MTSTAAKQMPLQLRPMLPSTKEVRKNESSAIFTKWNLLLTGKFNHLCLRESQFSEGEIHTLIREWEQENNTLQASLLEVLIAARNEDERRHLVQIHQSIIIRMMDKIHLYKQVEDASKDVQTILQEFVLQLEGTLAFIEEFLGNYLGRNEKPPINHCAIACANLREQARHLVSKFAENEKIDSDLKSFLITQLEEVCLKENFRPTYRELRYIQDLLEGLLSTIGNGCTEKIRELLFYLNYNEECYVDYEFHKLRQLTIHLDSAKQKVAILKLEQKKINQWPSKLDCSFTTFTPSLKEQVNTWINEEVKFFESGYSSQVAENGKVEIDSKIQTSLSVAKLAVIIRLLVIDKIIINRTVAPMLRIVAKLFTTLQRDEISFVSLEAKYHAPEKATVSAVRDMLFKWIKILDKL